MAISNVIYVLGQHVFGLKKPQKNELYQFVRRKEQLFRDKLSDTNYVL